MMQKFITAMRFAVIFRKDCLVTGYWNNQPFRATLHAISMAYNVYYGKKVNSYSPSLLIRVDKRLKSLYRFMGITL